MGYYDTLSNVGTAVGNTLSDSVDKVKPNSTPWYQTLGNVASSLSPIMSFINPLLGGASSLLGGLFGQSSQQEQNEFELQLNRENNEHNYRIWQEQKAHDVDMFNMENQANIDMWNMQNAYNDPSAQVERLRKAGLNPSLMMGGNPTGVASSAPASAHANSSQAPTMQAPNQMPSPGVVAGQQALQFLVGTAQSLSQLSQANAINRNTGIDVDTKYQNYRSGQLAYLNGKVDYRRNLLSFKKQEDEYNDFQLMRDDIILTAKATRKLAELNVENQEILNKYLDANQQLQLAKLSEEVALVIENKKLTIEQQKLVRNQAFRTFVEAQGIKLDNDYKEQTLDDRVYTTRAEKIISVNEAYINDHTVDVRQQGIIAQNGLMYGEYKLLRESFDSMVRKTIAENLLTETQSSREVSKQSDLSNSGWYWDRWTNVVGGGLRNLLGGIVSFNGKF